MRILSSGCSSCCSVQYMWCGCNQQSIGYCGVLTYILLYVNPLTQYWIWQKGLGFSLNIAADTHFLLKGPWWPFKGFLTLVRTYCPSRLPFNLCPCPTGQRSMSSSLHGLASCRIRLPFWDYTLPGAAALGDHVQQRQMILYLLITEVTTWLGATGKGGKGGGRGGGGVRIVCAEMIWSCGPRRRACVVQWGPCVSGGY